MQLQGLYIITDNALIPPTKFIETVEQAIAGGASIVQYRDKNSDKALQIEQALALRKLCHKQGVLFLINDDVTLAKYVNADGVHLGAEDTPMCVARAIMGENIVVGISCYNQLSLAQRAVNAGATYVAFGRFFSSATKPDAVPVEINLLQEARKTLTRPIVAIGGITPENGSELIAAGADCLAVIGGVFAQSDVTAAAQRYTQLFKT
jgi:thiamine-phosphate pyrophosphorylase